MSIRTISRLKAKKKALTLDFIGRAWINLGLNQALLVMTPSDQEIAEGLKISVVNYFLTHYGRILSSAGFPTQALGQNDILSIGEVKLQPLDGKNGAYEFLVNFRIKNHKVTYQGMVKNNPNKDIENESVSGSLYGVER